LPRPSYAHTDAVVRIDVRLLAASALLSATSQVDRLDRTDLATSRGPDDAGSQIAGFSGVDVGLLTFRLRDLRRAGKCGVSERTQRASGV
jgi:hypothetical protein